MSKTTGKAVTQAGMSLQSAGKANPNPFRHGSMGQAERAFSAASTFMSGIMAISASQFIGAPLKLIDAKFYEAYMAWTKESFAVLMTTITQWWAPTVVRVSGDDSMKGQLFQMDDGTLKCNFPHRLILMGNHQLYTDWLYLWWIAYTNKMHGRIYIILKESLKHVPIIGWGMQFYNFIFLSRKWEQDRYKFKQHLDHLKNPNDPMWLLIFPEGTNLSDVTRQKSAKWAEKTGVPDMKHQLLPRATGLQFCLQQLRGSTNWLYDCTIAYEGVPKGMYGQDIYTLKSSLFEGRPPKSVNMYFRRFKIADIPYQDDEAFSRWLINRWREKDYMLDYYYKFGNFPAEDPVKAMLAVEGKRKPNPAKSISTSVKGGGWDEFLSIFGPITTAAGAMSSIDMTDPLNFDEMMRKVAQSQQYNLLNIGKAPRGLAQQEAIRKALLAANKKNPLPNAVLDRLLKAPPKTQAEMTQTLKQAAPPDMARRVAGAPAADKALPQQQQKTAQSVAQSTTTHPQAAKPSDTLRQDAPLANMQSTITRPVTTLAVHAAGAQLKNLASQRAKTNGVVLPGQTTVGAPRRSALNTTKCVGGKAKLPNGLTNRGSSPSLKATSIADAVPKPGVTTQAPKKAASIHGATKTPSTSNAAIAAAMKKQAATKRHRPIGVQKYVNGNGLP
ncbi:Putative phospholipid/glycerol acyltransferase [Septoria linicola]|uniref:Phospholipid/glycerol acyltransferase n=1 Tax=Septoria linicola TaxID=215465 RepID=A0A9Q9B240_9PEZI|nr:Putative phospholipid/glycerol acyltransferase [Septoria linicola]